MTNTAFPRPVHVLIGLGFPHPIASATDARDYLDGVPRLLHDEVFQAARQACADAIAGRVAAEEAHDVFVAYARRRGVLIEVDPAEAALLSGRPREDIGEADRDQQRDGGENGRARVAA